MNEVKIIKLSDFIKKHETKDELWNLYTSVKVRIVYCIMM